MQVILQLTGINRVVKELYNAGGTGHVLPRGRQERRDSSTTGQQQRRPASRPSRTLWVLHDRLAVATAYDSVCAAWSSGRLLTPIALPARLLPFQGRLLDRGLLNPRLSLVHLLPIASQGRERGARARARARRRRGQSRLCDGDERDWRREAVNCRCRRYDETLADRHIASLRGRRPRGSTAGPPHSPSQARRHNQQRRRLPSST